VAVERRQSTHRSERLRRVAAGAPRREIKGARTRRPDVVRMRRIGLYARAIGLLRWREEIP